MHEKKRVLIIDNYDSFTYNLVHAVEEVIEDKVTVIKNDEIILSEVENYDYIILSPGPGLPEEAGLLNAVIETFKGRKKILGVCLGLQAIGEVYGCQLINLDQVYHGIQSEVHITDPSSPIYADLSSTIQAGRYHSWVIDEDTLVDDLHVTAREENGQIMSVEDRDNHVYAVQYHPESIMTPVGVQIIRNFLNL